MTEEIFKKFLNDNNINITNDQLELFRKYAEFLLEYNKTTNLTAIKTIEDVYLKHFVDSLLVLKHIKFKNEKVLDIGTGAGFPGVPLKIICPDIELYLLDSNGKKTTFLNKLKDILKLDYEVINDRAENYAKDNRESFDIVISRAVSRLSVLSELALPFVKLSGKFISYKSNYEEELNESLDAIDILSKGKIIIKNDVLPVEKSNRAFIIITKKCKTDLKYPRTYDKIIKKALQKNTN